MSKIFVLPKQLANQIAAWEVVERPASVVKELVENAIDAGATEVTVEIKRGWMEEIIVSDNGGGISEEDLLIATDKYTTSKIKSLEDLYNVMTFWFRWEALSSISSVSDFSIISKTQDSQSGRKLSFDGEEKKITPFPLEQGTKVIVKNLFYNTPARLNYIKTEKTEYAHISEFLWNMSLVHPEISFEFISDDRKVFSYAKNDDQGYRISQILWNDFLENSKPIEFTFSWIHISGYISDVKVHYTNKNRQILFVNKRNIKSPIIFKAISDAYNRFIPHGTHPAYVLFLDLDPTVIDVNVHPRKTEICFADEKSIFRAVYHAVNSVLEKTTLVSEERKEYIPEIIHSYTSESNEKKYYVWSGEKFKNYSPYKDVEHNPKQISVQDALLFSKSFLSQGINSTNTYDEREPEEKSFDVRMTPLWKIIGQIFNSYIIVETENSIQFLDQHALAERILYEKLCNENTGFHQQRLLIAEPIHITPGEEKVVCELKDEFISLWFDYEVMWSWTILINGIPDFIKKENLKTIFTGIITDIENFWYKKSNTLEEVRNKIRAYASCRSAVKFGDPLSLFEINKLLHDAVLTYSSTCPHGRPVIFEVGLQELKWKFER